MVFCNAYPIAAACHMPAPVVRDGLDAIWAAVIDLVEYGHDIDLNFGFARVTIVDKNLRFVFKKGFAQGIERTEFEDKMKLANTSCSSFWKTSYKKEWGRSALGNLVKKPQQDVVDVISMKTEALKLMSIDFSSTGVIKPRQNHYSRLRGKSKAVPRSRKMY